MHVSNHKREPPAQCSPVATRLPQAGSPAAHVCAVSDRDLDGRLDHSGTCRRRCTCHNKQPGFSKFCAYCKFCHRHREGNCVRPVWAPGRVAALQYSVPRRSVVPMFREEHRGAPHQADLRSRKSPARSARSYTAWQMRIPFRGAPRLHGALRTPGLVVSEGTDRYYDEFVPHDLTALPLFRHRTWATPPIPLHQPRGGRVENGRGYRRWCASVVRRKTIRASPTCYVH